MTTSEWTMQQMHNEMIERFQSMTYDEYENLCVGNGTLTVLDEVLSRHEDIDFTDDEAAKLAEYCCNLSNKFGQRYEIYQIAQDIEEAVVHAIVDNDGLGRLEYWINRLNEYDDGRLSRGLLNGYYQLTANLATLRGLNADELSELAGDYDEWLHQTADSIMDGFAEMYKDERYDDHDEWLQWLQGHEYLTWQEQQYINVLWNDEAKTRYKRN